MKAGSQLAEKEEILIAEVALHPNVFKIFQKGSVVNLKATNKRLSWTRPSTFIGIFPIGQQNVEIPMRQIAAVSVRQKFNVSSIFIIWAGILFCLLWFTLIGPVIGVALILSGIRKFKETAMSVTTTGGTKDYLSVPKSDIYILSGFVRDLQDAVSDI